jgi:mannose-6-phosphate isomerase-like protein (cupin superfamily)
MDGFFKQSAITADHALMEVIWLEPGHPPIPTDQHAHDQTMFVFSGSVQLVLNGTDRYVVNQGECLYIPGNVPHQATALGDEPFHALNIFAPVHRRYLPMVEHQLANEPASAGDSAL